MCVRGDGAHKCMCMWKPEEGTRYPRCPKPGVTGSCQEPGVGARNQTQVICKSSKCSSLLSHLSIQAMFSTLPAWRNNSPWVIYILPSSFSSTRGAQVTCSSELFFFFFNRSFVYTRKTETVASSGEETRSLQQPHSLPG